MKKSKVPSERPKPARTPPTVRARTLTHMKELLHNSTTVGAGFALACGIVTQGYRTYHDPAPPPPPPPQGVCANPDTWPVRHFALTSARWVRSGRKLTVNFKLWFYGTAGMVNFGGLREDEIHVTGATIKKMDLGLDKVDFVLTPIRGRDQAELTLAMQCDKKRIPLRYQLDLSKPHKKKGYIPIALVKQGRPLWPPLGNHEDCPYDSWWMFIIPRSMSMQ